MDEPDFLTNAENIRRPAYEAAMAKHPGLVRIEEIATDYHGRVLPDYFSVHTTNKCQDLNDFWKTYQEERKRLGILYAGEKPHA